MVSESMADGNVSLVLTHVQRPWSTKDTQKVIMDYIERHRPKTYQLFHPIFPLLIEDGEVFQSYSGDVPNNLKLKLQEDNKNGNQVTLAGGLEGECLEITFRQLKNLGIQPKILFEGISPEKSKYERLLRLYVYVGRYVLIN